MINVLTSSVCPGLSLECKWTPRTSMAATVLPDPRTLFSAAGSGQSMLAREEAGYLAPLLRGGFLGFSRLLNFISSFSCTVSTLDLHGCNSGDPNTVFTL